jgi:DNA-binding transcriptional ArsR family regulator
MKDEALLSKLEEIRHSMESFNEALVRVRYDDYKAALLEQIQEIFGDNSSSLLDSGTRQVHERSTCPNKKECEHRMENLRKETSESFGREDIGGAIMILEEAETELSSTDSLCKDKKCSKETREVIHQVKLLFNISDTLMFRNYIQPETGFTRLSSQGRFFSDHRRSAPEEISSALICELIIPLSNPFRVEIIRMLAREEHTFSEISRTLNLKTGHLQFHLKILKDAGYIRANRKRRMYSITSRGLTALEGIQGFASNLRSKKSRALPNL